jgi:nitrogen fixation/metabolism regulation signal transduction histidine kinase
MDARLLAGHRDMNITRRYVHPREEELYQENVDLNRRLTITVAVLNDEKNKRVRAERDAFWKDISFSAAHKMGNPMFAIETNLDPLKRRIEDGRVSEAVKVVQSIRNSVEKAKGIVARFKSLTVAQQIRPRRSHEENRRSALGEPLRSRT